ncbi:MAG: 7-cyano-7-deazaguanine synthase [Planctomycetota bacterium]
MAGTRAMLLHAGGPRSLVAGAVVTREQDASRVIAVCIDDGRPDAPARLAAAQLAAEAQGIKAVDTLALPHLAPESPDAPPPSPALWAAQALPAVLALAQRRRCDRLIWPASAGPSGDTSQALRIAELAELVMAMAALDTDVEPGATPRLDTPLAELSDAQVVALGERLGVDWRLARSCTSPTVGVGRPGCGACPGCARRERAFAAAAVADPLALDAPARRPNAA